MRLQFNGLRSICYVHKDLKTQLAPPHIPELVCIRETVCLMIYRKTVGIYCEIHTEHTTASWDQNAEILLLKRGGKFDNHWYLKGSIKLEFQVLLYSHVHKSVSFILIPYEGPH